MLVVSDSEEDNAFCVFFHIYFSLLYTFDL